MEQQYEQVVARVLPSVVQISTSSGSGSGVVYDTKGDIVTNAHVVGASETLQVALASGGKPLPADVVGVFAPDDLAVIKVDSGAGSLHPASFGRSASVQAGEIVLAMGNPLGLTGTVTDGIVSATGRTVTERPGQAQPVLISRTDPDQRRDQPGQQRRRAGDLAGQLIGIPTLAATEPAAGRRRGPVIGFAIPSNTVTGIAGQLIATGKVTNSGRASLGITAQTVADASRPAGRGRHRQGNPGRRGRPSRHPARQHRRQTWPASQSRRRPRCNRCWPRASPVTGVQAHVSRDGAQSTVQLTLGRLTS